MSKFIETEIYGNCDVNNNSTVNGKVYNDDILYASFSNEMTDPVTVDVRIHIRRFDDTLTKSGVPMVHWWFAKSGSDASSNQEPSQIDSDGYDTITISYSTGFGLDPTPGTTVDPEGFDLHTAIVDENSHDIVINLTSNGDDISITRYLNAMVQGIVYSERFEYAHEA